MLREEEKMFLEKLIEKAALDSRENPARGYILLDASDTYERVSNGPYEDVLIYSCIELELYRDGYPKTAKNFCSLWQEEHQLRPRRFFDESCVVDAV